MGGGEPAFTSTSRIGGAFLGGYVHSVGYVSAGQAFL